MPYTAIANNSGNILATKDEEGMARAASSTNRAGRLLNLAPGVFETLEKVKPSGALQARKQANGVISLFWRYSIGTRSERVAIGLYDSSAPPKSLAPTARGYSFAAAVRASETLALEHYGHKAAGGRPALQKAKRRAEADAAAKAENAGKNTLRNLLGDYADHLQGLGRSSHRDARSIFELHVNQAYPDIAALPANAVCGEQIANMMRSLHKAEKGRTSNKLRSYIRAAYQVAKASKSKSTIPEHFKAYEITHNPAKDTEPDEAENRASKKPLLEADLLRYWHHIKKMEGFKGAVLRLHLLTGGQRIEQLVKLQTKHVKAGEILLFDGKGRPGKAPRENPVPLVQAASDALRICNPTGAYAISTNGGETHLAATTLSRWAKEAAAEAAIAEFQAKRVRSGVETLLAKAGIDREKRGRLQSHGISGVQARHYDGHDYMPEKLDALMILHNVLTRDAEPKKTTRATSSREPTESANPKALAK